MKNNFLFLSLVVLLLTSCSVEKRVYNRGYHVAKNGNVKIKSSTYVPKAILEPKKERPVEQFFSKMATTEIAKEPIFTSTQRLSVDAPKPKIKPIPVKNPCDSIVLKNGERKLIKVIEVNDSTIQFSDCKDQQVITTLDLEQVDLLILKSGEQFKITPFRYRNEKKVYYETTQYYTKQENVVKNIGIASFGLSILALMVFLMFFFIGFYAVFIALGISIIGLILGSISLGLGNKYPQIKKFKVYSILGMIFNACIIFAAAVMVGVLWSLFF